MIKEIKNTVIKMALSILSGLLIVILLYSCEKEENVPQIINRVVLVYLGGDNNLSSETYDKIEAIRKGWNKSIAGKLLVYTDPSDAAPQLIEVCLCDKGNPITKIIKQYEEENSADSKVFASVVEAVKSLYYAPSYGLILFSHASGWLPEGTLSKPKSILIDQKVEMNIIDFSKAIPDNTFDFILFEACFMSGIEVAYELKDKTDYILASSTEILSPGFTNIYTSAISKLFEKEADIKGFAQSGFNNFNRQSGWQQSATFSVIKTSELKVLATYIKQYANYSQEIDINSIQHFDRYSYHLFFDFEDYYSRLLPTQNQQEELAILINNIIVWKASTLSFMLGYNGFEIKKHSGMTSYISQTKYQYLNQEYTKLEWYKAII